MNYKSFFACRSDYHRAKQTNNAYRYREAKQ